MNDTSSRVTEHDIDRMFPDRWSPRAFDPVTIAQADLLSLFEAARWAPSSFNSQPWRFVYAHRDTPSWQTFLDLLVPFNRSWAQNASALVVITSKTTMITPQSPDPVPSSTHSFDTGAAWAMLAVQAHLKGWATHGMVGFDRDAARVTLGIPEGDAIEAAIAIGKRGDKASLPEALRGREVPSSRKSVDDFAFEGQFDASVG